MNILRCIVLFLGFVPGLGITAPEPILASDGSELRDPTLRGIAFRERIVVLPDVEDPRPAAKNRWQKFEEALGPGRSARRTVTAWRSNDGSRAECYTHCAINCCVESGRFSLLGAGFGSR